MKNVKFKSAFTMIELVFVIVIIGILAVVAVPRLAATRDDATITKNKVVVASIRNALSMERQKRILRGDTTVITAVGDSSNAFDKFSADKNGNQADVLEYPIKSEDAKDRWLFSSATGKDGRDQYIFKSILDNVAFEVVSGRFKCNTTDTSNTNVTGCEQLTN